MLKCQQMSMIDFLLSLVEHEKGLMTSGPGFAMCFVGAYQNSFGTHF